MRIRVYLIISSGGGVEVRKQRPPPAMGRVAILLNIDISNAWFEQPVPVVNLAIPDSHVLPMPTINTEPLPDDERAFVNAREEIEDEDGNTRPMTPDERRAWEQR